MRRVQNVLILRMDALHARAQRHKIQILTRDRQFIVMYNENTHHTHSASADNMPTGHQATHQKKTNTTAYSETVESAFKQFCKMSNSQELLKKPAFVKTAHRLQQNHTQLASNKTAASLWVSGFGIKTLHDPHDPS